jgi:hypothetical protein
MILGEVKTLCYEIHKLINSSLFREANKFPTQDTVYFLATNFKDTLRFTGNFYSARHTTPINMCYVECYDTYPHTFQAVLQVRIPSSAT